MPPDSQDRPDTGQSPGEACSAEAAGECLAREMARRAEAGLRVLPGNQAWLIPLIAGGWSLFQLALPSLIILEAVYIRAIHLAFALSLVFLSYPALKRNRGGGPFSFLWARTRIPWLDLVTAAAAALAALYIALDYEGLAMRQGMPETKDIVIGLLLLALLLEACRRSLGPALPVVALGFIFYAFFAPHFPDILAARAVSLERFIGQETMSTQGIYGIPLDVSATIVYLFVLLGAMMDRAGGGAYFVQLAYSLLGSFRGGPAKAAVMASGLTGMVSGSSIANVVTTGTFTIPLMKSAGYPPEKAAAVEVAASTDGQLMPPIMGAAAFIMAEYTNLPYLEVVKAAAFPALFSYMTLFFITHLEAMKLGLLPTPRRELPPFLPTLRQGVHFLMPLAVLIYQLVFLRHSPELAALNAILTLAALIVIREQVLAHSRGDGLLQGLKRAWIIIWDALVAGGRNMMGIGAAVAGAGIIVGVVNMGLGGLITEIVQMAAGGNLWLLLFLTALACIVLGMGLPTTATYIVMASLTATVIVELGPAAGLEVPLIAAHLFVFYFGILADDTPPVGLAAYAASAISGSDPIRTGLQSFTYDIRTAILPFMFILNTRLLLIGVDSLGAGIWVFATGLLAMFAFASATQGWLITSNRWWETVVLLASTLLVLLPASFSPVMAGLAPDAVKGLGLALMGLVCLFQYRRNRNLS